MSGVLRSANEFLTGNRASESQPLCPTSMYLIKTLGWRWARRELSKQPQRSTWNTGSNVRNWQCAKMTFQFQQGARGVVGEWLFALARRGAIGGMSGSRSPRTPYANALPEVAIGGWRWGAWWEMPKGTRETMTGAHLGSRGAGRRRSYSATAAPAWSAGVAAMAMGATMWIFGARFFGTFWQRTRDVENRGRFVLMDQTERF